MFTQDNFKNIITPVLSKMKDDYNDGYNLLKNNMDRGWVAPGLVEEIKGGSATALPIGTIKTFEADEYRDDTWLICDGTEHNISDYPDLASWIEYKYGSKNYYGGDGEETFAVADYMTPKEEQDLPISTDYTSQLTCIKAKPSSSLNITMLDTYGSLEFFTGKLADHDVSITHNYNYNGDLNQIYVSGGNGYSQEERCVGEWIDGRPLYQQTVIVKTPSSYGSNVDIYTFPFRIGMGQVINSFFTYNASGADYFRPMPATINSSSLNAGAIVKKGTDADTVQMVITSSNSTWANKDLYMTLQYTKEEDEEHSFKPDMLDNYIALSNEILDDDYILYAINKDAEDLI